MNKLFLLLCALVCFFQAFSQEFEDTVCLSSVTVLGETEQFFTDGAKLEIIDSLSLSSASSTVSDVLLHSTSSLIKSYGHSGSASTLSLRGAGASRSAVMWEGFQLNSITMGETDLSLLPAQSFNYLAIDHSGSAAAYGSGSVGGVLHLAYKPSWKKEKLFAVQLSQASFETYNASFRHSIGTNRLNVSGSYFYSQSEGNYPYYDYVRLDTFNRKNADYSSYGFVQNVHYKFSHSSLLQAGLWYTVKDARLPGIIGTNLENVETQKDSIVRMFAMYKKLFSQSVFTVKSAVFNSYQKYTKKITPLDTMYSSLSEIDNLQSISAATFKMYVSSRITSFVEGQYTFKRAHVDNYGDAVEEQQFAGVAGLRYETRRIHASFGVRKEYVHNVDIPFVYNFGAEFHCDSLPLVFHFSIGKKFRRPTFNELYWKGWGNPDLVSENGFSFETGVQYSYTKKHHAVVTDIAYFQSDIKDMIMWNPEGSVWKPMNVSHAQIQGIEFRAHHVYSRPRYKLQQKFGYDYNTSHIVEMQGDEQASNHQMYYVPQISMHYSPAVSYKKWLFGSYVNYQSYRYYGTGKVLPSYFTFDFFVNLTVRSQKVTSNLRFTITNILDKRYELIRSYPIPGRSFEFSLNFIIK
jgi:vitamin B12 transporter